MKERLLTLGILVSLAVLPLPADAQRTDSGDQAWQRFYQAFSVAVTNRDRRALGRMMANPFETNGGGRYTPMRFLNGMTSEGWTQLQRSVARGTKPLSGKGKRRRVTTDADAGCPIFELGRDGRWRWTAVMGD